MRSVPDWLRRLTEVQGESGDGPSAPRVMPKSPASLEPNRCRLAPACGSQSAKICGMGECSERIW